MLEWRAHRSLARLAGGPAGMFETTEA
jgi:hypothetical protein